MDFRRNHSDMTPQQKTDFVNSILLLKNNVDSVLRPGLQSRYDDFVQIHKNSMGLGNPLAPNPHRSPLFYPWHRAFLRQFEVALQTATSNPANPTAKLPAVHKAEKRNNRSHSHGHPHTGAPTMS